MLSTSNSVNVPTFVRLELTTPVPSVVALSTDEPATLYSLPVVALIFSVVVQLFVACSQVHFLSAPVTLTTIPASSTPESVNNVLSLVIASSICLSSTLSVLTSILAVDPSTNKFPVTRISPATSKVYSGVLSKIPTRLFAASTNTASTCCDPAAVLVTLII